MSRGFLWFVLAAHTVAAVGCAAAGDWWNVVWVGIATGWLLQYYTAARSR